MQEEERRKMTTTFNLANEDINLLSDSIAEVAKYSLKGISKKHLQLTNNIIEHMNQLIEAVNEAKATIKDETYGVDPSIPSATLDLVLPIKIEIPWECHLGTNMISCLFILGGLKIKKN